MKRTAVIAIVAVLAGCANYRPIVDTAGGDPVQYQADLTACQGYAGRSTASTW